MLMPLVRYIKYPERFRKAFFRLGLFRGDFVCRVVRCAILKLK
jgi:hypothetical protein